MKTNHWIRLLTYGLMIVLVQVLIINNLELNGYMFPQLYIILLLTLPVNIRHWESYLIAFVLGYIIDSFTYTPGLHSFTAVFIMFLRYIYFNRFVEKDFLESGITPNFDTTEGPWLIAYISIFAFVYHFVLLIMENFTFHHFGATILRILYSSSLAILLILLFMFVFRNRTNDET